jgi:hypothetical protein
MPQNPQTRSIVNLARLARELAQDIFEPDQIRQAHSLTTDQFEKILDDPGFQKMLREMVLDWQSASGTAERVRVKAATAVEVALDSFFQDVMDRSIPLPQRTDALKALMKLGELGEKEQALGPVGGGVSISINLGTPGQGAPPKTVVIEGQAIPEESPVLPG